jgi:hypothetical protein
MQRHTIGGSVNTGDALVESPQSVCPDNQRPTDSHTSVWVALTPQVVMGVVETLLYQDKPTWNDEVLHLEVMRLYHLILPRLAYQEYQGVRMSLEIVEGLVLRALRKSGISLGEQNEFHKLFL